MKTGKVFLVGAGPGDVGLITVKGMEAIKQAEVILYDRLANPKLLEYATGDCELIYCGKLPDRHILRQENINDLLVEKALAGKIVVRLKGGDPGVFGRVGEEAAALALYQIPFEIVPGISSGIAAPLYAGIPVTHRDHAESFAVVTAHDKSKEGKPLLDWEGLVRGVDTIAFYMGVGNLPFICENLVNQGKPASTPVILIQWGTFGRQKTLQGTLADISEKVLKAKFTNPAIILVGEVISLREKISWFESKPLYGRQILLARTGESVSGMAQHLMDQGADVIEFPKWKKTVLPVDLKKVSSYDKILFTSPESVGEFFSAVFENGVDIRKIHADFFGASTKSVKALNDRGFIAQLAEEMPETGNLLIVGDDSILRRNSENANLMVTSKKELDFQFLPIFKRMLEEADGNTMVFPSSASVEPFIEALRESDIDTVELLKDLQVVSMGKQTMAAVEAAGLPSHGMPEKATKEALVDYLAGHLIKDV
ncbi:uroporphyrin-III C-methyltransferase [Neobacillus bataviensis LMG 21833]|uniref:Uroporphyrinogen-III C-methyltransferase n=1 Tax=Neobacillus bataviensis LMG 21833 TaxID=1117379 RepID=K6DT78_9BACI|nr:uroporphyrinogen-III C-methyltransferase [Neobacillus bataviensis]EKN71549.1 uroporphyrin-III C-methyltransferase [Neobacillus bataviensis LMG 21833]